MNNSSADGAAAWIAVQVVLKTLIDKGLMTPEDAQALVKQAEEEGRYKAAEDERRAAAGFSSALI
ncbi:hypothetical protein WDJ50_18500 (plasmid) [Deinococcus sp. VB142]|uniref:Uncharacterized protein n=1 Tax=Deinococcus sp. VB142 TaxID=3112952 RepID=A0AAU6Q806_9DEIO